METLKKIWTKILNWLKMARAVILRFVELGGLKTVWRFVLKYNEWFFSFPIGMLLLYHATKAYMKNGLQAYDIGVTQKLFLGFAFFFFVIGMSRVVHKLQWPVMSKLVDEDTNSKWEKVPYIHVVWLSFISLWVLILSLSILIASI